MQSSRCLWYPYQWLPGNRLICKIVPDSRVNHPLSRGRIPQGPIVQKTWGENPPNRDSGYTQPLERILHDEAIIWAILSHFRLERVCLGTRTPFGSAFNTLANLHQMGDSSTNYLASPFSLSSSTSSTLPTKDRDLSSRQVVVHRLADLQLADDIPIVSDSVRPGPRAGELAQLIDLQPFSCECLWWCRSRGFFWWDALFELDAFRVSLLALVIWVPLQANQQRGCSLAYESW